MNINPCRIIFGKSMGILENLNTPIGVYQENKNSFDSIVNSFLEKATRVCFVGSSCMYPDLPDVLSEDLLGSGAVYPGNSLFSYTKLLGLELCKAISKQEGYQYFVAIPSDIFGNPNDSHFISQMMAKFHRAKFQNLPKVTLWGTGTSIRHPIYEEDFERILNEVILSYNDSSPINIATDVSYAKSISSIALDIKEVVGYHGDLEWDAAYPDGQKVKILSNEKLTKLGIKEFTPWMDSLAKAYQRYLNETQNHL